MAQMYGRQERAMERDGIDGILTGFNKVTPGYEA